MQFTRRILLSLALLFCTAVVGAQQREISVELTVPDTSWSVTIDKVYRVGDELWVISSVSRDPDLMGAQVISTIRASLEFEAPDLPVQSFIIGKTWAWENSERHTFIENLKQIDAELQAGRRLYPAPRPCP